MHSRRIAAFLLGGWMCCSLLLALIASRNLHAPGELIDAPIQGAADIIHNMGPAPARLLLQHFAAEQNRANLNLWEEIEIPLALALGLCLLSATQKRLFPLILCGIMLAIVLFQFKAITPELTYSGRGTDFPPVNQIPGSQARVWALDQIYMVTEILKLVVGVILAGFIFIFRPRRESRRRNNAEDATRPIPLEL